MATTELERLGIVRDGTVQAGISEEETETFVSSTEKGLEGRARGLAEKGALDSVYVDLPADDLGKSEWKSAMVARLKLAKTFLKDDGLVFVSADDSRLRDLKQLCDEIFGENRFVACAPKNAAGVAGTVPGSADRWSRDYFLIYRAKNLIYFRVDRETVESPAP